MTKARDLADFIATGTLADGSLEVADVAGLQTELDGKEPADATILKDADIDSTVQAYDAGLTDVAGLAVTDGNFIVGNGTNWVAESGATARTSLGLGAVATAEDIGEIIGADGTSGQYLSSDGDGTASWVDLSAGGMTLISATTIGTDSYYTITLPTNWWNGTYRYLKVIYPCTYQSGDPPTGTANARFRIAGNSGSVYTVQGTYGSTVTASIYTQGLLTYGSGQDNTKIFIVAEIFCDGTNTFVNAHSASTNSVASGSVKNFINGVTATSFDLYQPYVGSERYRFEGTCSIYGVK